MECDCNSFERSHIQHMSGWPNWLGVRLQSSDSCCWEIKSHWRQLFSKFIFPEYFCLTDLLSDFLSDLLIGKNPIILILQPGTTDHIALFGNLLNTPLPKWTAALS